MDIEDKRFILIGIVLAVVWWFIESHIHVYFFHDGNLLQQMFRPHRHELWMRSFTAILLILFSIYAQVIVNKRKHADAAVRESEERYRSFVERFQGIAFRGNMDFTPIFFHGSVEAITGYTQEEFIAGKPRWNEVIHPEDLPVLSQSLEDTASVPDYSTQRGYRIIRKDGKMRWVQEFIHNICDESEQPVFVQGVIYDITDRKRAEIALRESEEKLAGIVASVTDAMIMVDKEFNVVWTNDVSRKVFGPGIVGKKCYRVYHGRDKTCEPCIVTKCFKDGKVHEFETEMSVADGSRQSFWCTASVAAWGEGGHPKMVVESLRDITERKQAQKEIETLRQRMEFILGVTKTGIDIIDSDYNIQYINTEWEKLYGVSTGKKCYEYFMGDSEPCQGCGITQAMKTQTPVVTEEVLVKEGNRPIQVTTIPFQNDNGEWLFAEVNVDITERKRAEEALRESEERYRTITATAQDAIITMDHEGKISYWNPAAEKMFGYTSQEAVGQELHTFLGPQQYHEAYRNGFRKFRETGWGTAIGKTLELSAVKKNGTEFPIELSVSAIQIQDQWHATGIMRDISERKRTEKAIRESESFLQSVFEGIRDGITILDRDLNIIRTNSRMEEMYAGQMPIIGRKCYAVYQQRETPCPWCPSIKTLSAGESYNAIVPYPSGEGPNGWIDLSSFPLKDPDGCVIGVIEHVKDISERKRLEAQLRQAQKMEAIGTLAGGIAHDFNNILQAISGYVQLLLMNNERNDPEARYLKQVDGAVQSASDLTRRLLISARKVESVLRPTDLNEQVMHVEKILRRTIPRMIDIKLRSAENLKIINADTVQLEQVMMNLGINAKDSMPEGGELVFETKNVVLDEAYCRVHIEAFPGEYVLLSVSDTGHGMDKETLEHIFEPFYTTRETGKGTGLGLAMVYGIVKAHGGHVTCYSEPGHGAVFNVYFPVSEDKHAEAEPELEDKVEIPGGHETILLVDDEEILRNQGRAMLEEYGYTTITAENGEMATEIYKDERGRIDLVILDVGMPGFGGHQCFRELRKIDPEIKAIIASGYASDGRVRETLEAGAAGFIGKPYRLKHMLRMVREILDQ